MKNDQWRMAFARAYPYVSGIAATQGFRCRGIRTSQLRLARSEWRYSETYGLSARECHSPLIVFIRQERHTQLILERKPFASLALN